MADSLAESSVGSVQPTSHVAGGVRQPGDGQPAPAPAKQFRRVIQLDFVRGIAILAVMEFHFLSVPVNNVVARTFEYSLKRVGWMGVDFFFVLSGFLVGGLLVQELLKTGDLRIRRFLLRRMFKIWPAYYVYIFFQIFARKHPLNTFAWQNLLNIQNYTGTSLKHTWSLAVEEHFYIFLPLLILFIFRKPRLRRWTTQILAAVCLLVLSGRLLTVYYFGLGDPQLFTHARIDSLLFGVILSYLFYSNRVAFDRLLTYRIPMLVIVVAGLTFGLVTGHDNPQMWSFGYTINYLWLGSLLLLIYGYHGRLTKTLAYRAVAQVGIYSYGIYLWHQSVREPLARLVTHLPVNIRWGSLLVSQYATAIVLGVLMTKAVEFPMLRLRDRLIPRGPAQLPPEVA